MPSSFIAANVPDLIAAINAANQQSGSNTITLVAPTSSPYVLTGADNFTNGWNGLPVIAANDNLTIVGNGDAIQRSTATGTPTFRFFDVTAGASLTLQSLTLQGGLTYAPGGAIDNAGILNVSSSTLTGNTAWGGYGGAIDNSGSVDIRNSTLSGNSALGSNYTLSGSGIFVTDGFPLPPPPPSPQPSSTPAAGGAIFGGAVTITNSTIAGNTAVGGSTSVYWYTYYSGDAPYTGNYAYDVYFTYGGDAFGGALDVAQLSVDHCTIADNGATGGNGDVYYLGLGYGAGIYSSSKTQVYDTILANNAADIGLDLYGSINSLGHNLIGNSTGGSGFATSDLLNVNPQLGPLQNNGGPTQTMALLAGSSAIDAGDNTGAPAYDQRGPGFARIFDGAIDVGAFEVQSVFDKLVVSSFPSAVTAGAAGSFTVTAKLSDGSTDTGYIGTVHFSSSDTKAVLPTNYAFTPADAGVHTFIATLKTAGTQSITVADTLGSALTASEAGIAVNAAAASQFNISGPSSVSAGVAFSLTVKVEDAYGNVVTNYRGTIHFTSSDNRATRPANYTFTAADKGVHTFTDLVLRKRDTQKITITDTLNSSLTGSVVENVL